ncbi:DUF6585 family protein [Catenuloplanes indicus]|uniref:Uncharacterized protein n=1 Tax=Catenuloplanes indicus TaxID=137267 RepID=A0AAE3VTV8_9ACTN|nr:DUF6585 family protein [Catenuloplanes indicus]MDQ0364123.1 hypothetical protein [Catenuloplanes indicus]
MVVPEAVARAADTGGFGAVREVHAPDGPVAGIGATVAGLLFCGLFLALFALLTDEPAAWYWFGLLAIALLARAVAREVPAGRRRDRPHFYVFAGGLVRDHRGETTAWAWNDVEYVERPSYQAGAQGSGGWSYTYLLRSYHGLVEIPLPRHFEGVATGIAAAALDRARAALNRGETVRFGPIEAGPDGLTVSGETLRWREIDSVGHGREYAGIYRRTPRRIWKRLPVATIPDVRALASLAGERARAST